MRRTQLGLFGLLAVAVGRLCFWAAVPPVTDTDVWWVAAAGRDLLREHVVPHLNRYSFTDPLRPWTMHEWLFGPVYAWGLGALGPRFFSLVGLVCAAVTSAVVISACLSRSHDWRVGALFAAVVLFAFGMHLTSPRPPNVALFFPVAMAVIAFAPRFGRRALVLGVVLELVWTNAHGSFPLGPLLLLAGAAAETVDRRRRLAGAGLAATVTLVNPYGLALHRLVIGYALGAAPIFGRIHQYIVEFSPIWRSAGRVGSLEWLVLVVVLAIAVRALLRAGQRVRGGVALVLVALAVLAVRNLALAGFVSAVVLAPTLPKWSDLVTRHGVGPDVPPVPRPMPPARFQDRAREETAEAGPPAAPQVGRGPIRSEVLSRRSGSAVAADATAGSSVPRADVGGANQPDSRAERAPEVLADESRRSAAVDASHDSSPQLPLAPGAFAALSVAPGMLVFLAVMLVIGGFRSTRMIAPVLGGPDLVELLHEVPPGAKLFVPFRATGVAIWYRPDASVRVFYDARNDCYSPEVADTFFALDAGAGTDDQMRAALAHYGTDAAIVSEDLALRRALAGGPGWGLRARSGRWSLWLRRRAGDAPPKSPPASILPPTK